MPAASSWPPAASPRPAESGWLRSAGSGWPAPVGRPGTDPAGTVLLAAATTAGMLAISALSGLGVPAWTAAVFAAVAVLTGAALLRHERRAAAPMLDLRAMAASGTSSALLGALCAYLVLFGPLVLFPQVISAQGGSAESAGLLLTALPAGFGLAAAVADRLLPVALAEPAPLPARRRGRRPAARRRWRYPRRMRYQWCYLACSASALASTLRRTTPRSWPRSPRGTRPRQAGW